MDPALIAKLLIRGGVAAVFMAARKWESIHVAVLAIRASGQARRDEVSGDIVEGSPHQRRKVLIDWQSNQ